MALGEEWKVRGPRSETYRGNPPSSINSTSAVMGELGRRPAVMKGSWSPRGLTVTVLVMMMIQKFQTATVCNPDRFEYRHPDFECRVCDGCSRGYGLHSIEGLPRNENSELLECPSCRPCQRGHFNDWRRHECARCAECSPPLVERVPCTAVNNTVCGEGNHLTTVAAKSNGTTEETPKPDHTNIIIIVCLSGSFSTVIVLILIYCCKSKRCCCRAEETDSVPEADSLVSSSRSTMDSDSRWNEADKEQQANDTVINMESLPVENSSAIVNNDDMYVIVKNIGKHYKFLMKVLQLAESEIFYCKSNNPHNIEQAIFDCLEKWKQKEGKGATRGVLYQALKTINSNDLAERFRECTFP